LVSAWLDLGFTLVSPWLETDPLLLKYKSNDDHLVRPVQSAVGRQQSAVLNLCLPFSDLRSPTYELS